MILVLAPSPVHELLEMIENHQVHVMTRMELSQVHEPLETNQYLEAHSILVLAPCQV